jgi:DUF1016 N-terminal domain
VESTVPALPAGYVDVRSGIAELFYAARRAGARSVNALMTANYWAIGRRIVQAEQKGKRRAGYGEQLIARLSLDLTQQFRRGFSPNNLENMCRFFLAYSTTAISETLSRISGSARGNNSCVAWCARKEFTMTVNNQPTRFEFSEADVCREYVTTAIKAADCGGSIFHIAQQRSFTHGRIVFTGRIAKQREGKRADYLLRYRRNLTLAVVEAKPYKALGSTGTSARRRHLNPLDCLKLKIPVPSMTTQQKLAVTRSHQRKIQGINANSEGRAVLVALLNKFLTWKKKEMPSEKRKPQHHAANSRLGC